MVGTAALAIGGVVRWVDLSPRVDADFFFAPDDPQVVETRTVRDAFPTRERIIVRVAGEITSPGYRESLAELVAPLAQVDGVAGVRSILTEDPDGSPLWGRVLTVPDSAATNILLELDEELDAPRLVNELDSVIALAGGSLEVVASGVPVIVERIRVRLFRDLLVFTGASLSIFGLLLALIYRDPRVVIGGLVSCLAACALSLLAIRWAGIGIGLLTANIVTIVFVLTLSHIVFITGNWLQILRDDPGPQRAMRSAAVTRTLEPSSWAMATTLLGFLSLLAASARPLRELGMAGAVGTAIAFGSAYLLYPAFLRTDGAGGRGRDDGSENAEGGELSSGRASRVSASPGAPAPAAPPARRRPVPIGLATALAPRRPVLIGLATVVLVFGFGVLRLDTDPGLLSYFASGDEIRDGLERIDAEGGSSPLEIVVRDPAGALDSGDAYDRMWAFQNSLEAEEAVGSVLSPAVVIAEARTQPLAGLLPNSLLLDVAGATSFRDAIASFLSEDRTQGRFSLRMREAARDAPRDEVIDRLLGHASGAGLEVVAVAGLYDLQRELGDLIARSLMIGIGGLMLLFAGVAALTARALRPALWMLACLAAIPVVVLGAFGHMGAAIDIITSPAANLSLAIGVDAMIHLVVRWRRFRGLHPVLAEPAAWARARAEMAPAVLSVTVMIALGFGIFALSAFPPTRRFGSAVILGTCVAALATLIVLPALAGGGRLSRSPDL